jgi:hypothetical protein
MCDRFCRIICELVGMIVLIFETGNLYTKFICLESCKTYGLVMQSICLASVRTQRKIYNSGAAISPRYKPEGRGFDS